MRRSLTPAVPPSMYRHFAVVTVLLTAMLAMFAEGEDRQAQAAPAAAVAVAADSPAAPMIVASRQPLQPAPEWWEEDPSSDGDTGRKYGTDSGTAAGFDDMKAPGHAPEYPSSLSDDERDLLLAGMQESGVPNAAAGD